MTQLFPRVAATHRGYDPEQVETFFARARRAYEHLTAQRAGEAQGSAADAGLEAQDEQVLAELESFTAGDVRSAAFDLVRRGYRAASVDAALDRLEAAFVASQRADHIAQHGQASWTSLVVERATTLYERLNRPSGQRFAPPERGRGYDAAAVDALLDRLVAYFDEGSPLTAADVRTVVFPAAPAARAYAEGPVDAYLDRVVDVLLAVE